MRYFILVGVVIAVVAAWTGAWFYIADQVRDEIEAAAGQNTPSGAVRYRGLEISGYPFRIQVELTGPRIELSGTEGGFRWATDKIGAVRHLWQPRHVLLDLTGQHQFEWSQDGAARAVTLDNGEAMASIETGAGGRLDRLSVDIKAPSLRGDGGTAFIGKRLQVHARLTPDADDSVDLALRGDGLELGAGVLPPELMGMARNISLLDIRTTVTGLPQDARAATPIASWLATWRMGGGTVEVRQFRLLWGDMEINATGSLALDDRMRPIGALTAKIRGHEQLLDIAARSGAMSKNRRIAAGAVLGLLAAAGGGVLSVPVRMQDGQLFLGPAAIAELAPLALR
ncbi:MAG: DUF2125 domain-containing protein [Alphaproteobacteria bacterium]|jgi:hypothetical protein